jgi:hypothetical protein
MTALTAKGWQQFAGHAGLTPTSPGRDLRVTYSRGKDDGCGIEVRVRWPQNRHMAPHLPMVLLAVHLTAAPEIPARAVQAAQARAAYIFAQAGIRLQWAEIGLNLQIVNCEPRGLPHDAAGFAVLTPGDLGYAAVAWPAVQREAAQMEVDPQLLLGLALAHELGHLLFGPTHAHSGIMSPRLGPKETSQAARGELLFTGVDGARVIVLNSRNPVP